MTLSQQEEQKISLLSPDENETFYKECNEIWQSISRLRGQLQNESYKLFKEKINDFKTFESFKPIEPFSFEALKKVEALFNKVFDDELQTECFHSCVRSFLENKEGNDSLNNLFFNEDVGRNNLVVFKSSLTKYFLEELEHKTQQFLLTNLSMLLEMRFSLMIYDAVIAEQINIDIFNLLNKYTKIRLKQQSYAIYQNLCIGLLTISSLGVALFAAASLISTVSFILPFITPIFVLSFMTLAGLSYGIINGLFACRMNIAYFLFGHKHGQRSFSLSNSPTVQGIHWGIFATGVLSVILGVIFSIVSASVGYCATSLLPISALAMLGLALVAEVVAQHHAHHFASHKKDLLNQPIETFLRSLDPFQQNALRFHLSDIKDVGEFHGNNTRNLIGYVGGFSVAITSMVLCSTLGLAILPQLFQTVLFSQYIPLAVAATMLVGVAIAMAYSMKHKDLILEKAPCQIEQYKPLVVPDVLSERIKNKDLNSGLKRITDEIPYLTAQAEGLVLKI